MFIWLLATLHLAVAGVPTPITVTTAEQALLSDGKIVVRDRGLGETIGIVDLQSTPKRTLEALLNLPARVDEVRPIQSIDVLEHSHTRIVARWRVGLLGIHARFHVWYETDWDQGWTQFGLDESQPNDIKHASGSYHVYPHGDGTRLVYRSDADTASKTPTWLREFLTGRSMRQQIAGIKARAEQH